MFFLTRSHHTTAVDLKFEESPSLSPRLTLIQKFTMCCSSLSKTEALNDPLTGVVQNHQRTDIHMIIPNPQNTAVKVTLWLGSVQHEDCVRAAVALGLRATVLRDNTDFEVFKRKRQATLFREERDEDCRSSGQQGPVPGAIPRDRRTGQRSFMRSYPASP